MGGILSFPLSRRYRAEETAESIFEALITKLIVTNSPQILTLLAAALAEC